MGYVDEGFSALICNQNPIVCSKQDGDDTSTRQNQLKFSCGEGTADRWRYHPLPSFLLRGDWGPMVIFSRLELF